ncbi:hypothetical protein [Bowmanella denitrificans]|uniref:hypothetical protein n=1 Tax=Bowmanella denitrificans TaxID=366582 RepID=UPI001C0EE893|nr:hypothetical protein [Bowmanella denitrificans]
MSGIWLYLPFCGAEIIQPLQDEEYGARGYMVKDPQGHMWYFGNYRPGQYWQ